MISASLRHTSYIRNVGLMSAHNWKHGSNVATYLFQQSSQAADSWLCSVSASMQNLPHSRCDASYNRDVSPPLLYVRKLQYSSSAANTVPPAFSFLNPVSLSGSRVNLCFASLSHWNAAVYLMSFAFLSGSVHLDDWTWLVVVPRVVLEGAKFLFLVRLNQFTLWPNDITCWQNFSWSILVIKLLEDHAVFIWKKKGNVQQTFL